jgi:internalin A
MLLLLVSLLFVLPAMLAGAEVPVYFADPALENAIRETLRDWDKELTSSDVAKLSSLDAQSKEIADLTGLEYAVNLKKLNLTNNKIVNLAPLAGLKNLENLNLKWNSISDISSLQGLKNLTYLSLENNNISNISPLAGLTNVTRLNLGKNQIRDLSPLKKLTHLEQLVIYFNEVSDISALANLINLQVLNLSDNNISNIAPLVANQEQGGLRDAFINVINNPLDTSDNSATLTDIKKSTFAHVEFSGAKQPTGESGTLAPAVEIKRPRGVRQNPAAEDHDQVRVEPEKPHTEQGNLNVRLMQFMLVFAVILLAVIVFVGYRLLLLLTRQRSSNSINKVQEL